jgi:hypothetical protein
LINFLVYSLSSETPINPLVWCAVGAHKTPRSPKAPNPLLVGEFLSYCEQTTAAGSDEGEEGMSAVTNDPIKIKRPAENDSANERPNECTKPSISRLVADDDAEPSTSYSRD